MVFILVTLSCRIIFGRPFIIIAVCLRASAGATSPFCIVLFLSSLGHWCGTLLISRTYLAQGPELFEHFLQIASNQYLGVCGSLGLQCWILRLSILD
ncbi:hypothetical protein BDV32DRAFT_84953 [Aspergillus pseudonomiae]|nr:hypothetical protein BDV32DRAFT_84953 [Aspergillus pseudonomiae]